MFMKYNYVKHKGQFGAVVKASGRSQKTMSSSSVLGTKPTGRPQVSKLSFSPKKQERATHF